MLADRGRTRAYRQAILKVVRPGDVVLDMGCGTGVLAFFACQAGARRVYAIEMGGIVEVASRISRKNGLDGRVVFVSQHSLRARLPERADVLVTETIGNWGPEEGMLASVIDARRRFLKRDGRLIPRAVELFLAPVELPGVYQKKVEFWSARRYGVDLSPARAFVGNMPCAADLSRRDLLSGPVCLLRLDLSAIRQAGIAGQASFTVRRGGVLHGLGGWFSAELCRGVSLTNAPPNTLRSWRHRFFPIEKPVSVSKGDRLDVRIFSRGNGSVLSWQVACEGRFRFGHSSLFGLFPRKTKFSGGP